MNVLLLGALVWLGVALAALAGLTYACRHDLPDLADLDVSREEWQAHCDEALAVGNALVLPFGGLYETWSETDEAAYRVTVERAT